MWSKYISGRIHPNLFDPPLIGLCQKVQSVRINNSRGFIILKHLFQ